MPSGYVSREAARAVNPNSLPIEALISEYEQSHPFTVKCKVCNHPEQRELIDALLERGAGCGSISLFMLKKFQFGIGSTTLLRHKQLHLNARTTE